MPEDEKKTLGSLNIISFVVLLLTFCLFFYIAFIRTADQNVSRFKVLANKAAIDLKALNDAKLVKFEELKRLHAGQNNLDSTVTKVPISDVPMFLQKINNETIASGLKISNINKVDDNTYKLSINAPYYRLVNFLFKIEQTNLSIQDMSIHPLSDHKNQISMTLKVIKNEMSRNNLKDLNEFEKKYAGITRDPLQKEAEPLKNTGPSDVIDLTWEFKLTGIGFDRARYANIDHNNYYTGDDFKDMRIVKILKDRVKLQSGSQKFFIGFRKPVIKK